jgi:hypothetical protein
MMTNKNVWIHNPQVDFTQTDSNRLLWLWSVLAPLLVLLQITVGYSLAWDSNRAFELQLAYFGGTLLVSLGLPLLVMWMVLSASGFTRWSVALQLFCCLSAFSLLSHLV